MPTMHLTITTIDNNRGIAFYNKIFVDQVRAPLRRHLGARLPLEARPPRPRAAVSELLALVEGVAGPSPSV